MNANQPVLPEPFASQSSQHYVIPNGVGFQCLGFQNCFNETYALAVLLKQELPANDDFGTMKVLERHSELITQVAVHDVNLGTWFDPATPLCVRTVIDEVRARGKHIRIFFGDQVTGKASNAEHGTIGTIVLSSGALKRPQLVHNSIAAPTAIPCAQIVRIMDIETMSDLYRHPTFHTPDFDIVDSEEHGSWRYCVAADGVSVNGFSDLESARRWVNFMRGHSLAK